jgi:GT2 family glycosyltransferase
MARPLVSIVIPAFNQAAFVGAAIASALEQTYRPIEVVVVNDGSTDDTPGVLASLADHPELRTVHQQNAGLPAARNRGLFESRGDILVFLDSDDLLDPAHVERLAAALATDPDLAFAYCDIQMVDRAGVPSSAFSVSSARRVLHGDIFESLLIGGYFPPHAVAVRRRWLDAVGAFELALGGHADYELWLRLTGAGGRAAYVDERLARYRVYDGSMSRDLEHMRRTRLHALERVARRYPARLAAGLSAVQEAAVDLHAANQWLREQWREVIARLDAERGADRWTLLEHLDAARLEHGRSDQLAEWDTTLGGGWARALFLHPPARLTATIPTGRARRLLTAVAIHPDAWEKPNAGPCAFSVTLDQNVSATVVLDPHRREADRRWLDVALDVPASSTGEHQLTVETAALAGSDFGWALFREVTFMPRA